MEKLKEIWKKRQSLIIAILVMALVTAGIVVFAVVRDNARNAAAATPTPDPNATPTTDPYVVMERLWGDWRRVDENASGFLELHLHGDNTAVYVYRGVFDPEPQTVSTRWQAQDGLLSLITERSEVTEFEMVLDGDRLTLTYATGMATSSVVFERYTPDPAE